MEKIKNQKEVSTHHENLNNIPKLHKLDLMPDIDKQWMFIKETVYKVASVFMKESQTRKNHGLMSTVETLQKSGVRRDKK